MGQNPLGHLIGKQQIWCVVYFVMITEKQFLMYPTQLPLPVTHLSLLVY